MGCLRPTGVSVDGHETVPGYGRACNDLTRRICAEKKVRGKFEAPDVVPHVRVTLERWQGVHTRVHAWHFFPLSATQTSGTPAGR
jgi:hypothetical protein